MKKNNTEKSVTEADKKERAKLDGANKELLHQHAEREMRAAELVVANKELLFQKEMRAAELVVANKELLYQNEQKEMRAAELVVANKELLYQNEQKEIRAAELVIANKELIFQNSEKEKRARELTIVISALEQAESNWRKLNEELEQKVSGRTAELEAINKELEAFSYSVSHDLRAPIRAISGYANILKEDNMKNLDPAGVKYLESLIHNSQKMGELIDDLLAFSRLGRKQVAFSEINMISLVDSIRQELASAAPEKQPEFTIHTLLSARGDQSLIRQVWINLISNAIKYSQNKSKATIEIGAYRKESHVVYYIRDNGAGFDMEYYDKLFGVFQRLHSQEEFEGTGIGLAIVQKLVHRHHGTVWAESKQDEGTCFYFSLPAHE